MLSAQNRMRNGQDFTVAVRRGRRAGRPSLVVHYLTSPGSDTPRVGFVVPRSVGTAVVRNRVQRRLRHLMRDRVSQLPPGALLVVRAQPAAATTADLRPDLDRALSVVQSPRRPSGPARAVDPRDATVTS